MRKCVNVMPDGPKQQKELFLRMTNSIVDTQIYEAGKEFRVFCNERNVGAIRANAAHCGYFAYAMCDVVEKEKL